MEKYNTTVDRILAGIVDFFVFIAAGFIINSSIDENSSISTSQFFHFFQHTVFVSYSIFFHWRYGQTLGKMFLKIKIVDVSETKNISFWQSVLRDIFSVLIWIISFPIAIYIIISNQSPSFVEYANMFFDNASFIWVIAEIVTCLFNEKRRALHDYIAGTVVIKTDYLANLPIEKTA